MQPDQSTSERNYEKPEAPVDWSAYLPPLPPRSEIDPEHTLSSRELTGKIAQYYQSRGEEFKRGSVYDVREYPELVDQGAQKVTRKINALDYVRTYASCGGHAHEGRTHGERATTIGRLEGSELEYIEPYLTVLIDIKDPRSAQLLSAMKEAVQRLAATYPNAHVKITEEPVDDRLATVTFSESLTVPNKWISENGKKTPQQLDREIEVAREKLSSADPEDARQSAHETWHAEEYVGRYKQEYQDYFASFAGRQPVVEFFKRLESAVH